MKSLSRQRKYPEDPISSEIRKVRFSKLRLKSNDKIHYMKDTPLVVMYHPLLKSYCTIIDENLSILCMHKDMKRACTPRPMV